ncbi:Transcription-repair-coupling factor [Castellaniella defragrans]
MGKGAPQGGTPGPRHRRRAAGPYARRAAREGLHFKFPARDYQAFAEGFGFEEAPDQASAIEAVNQDMTSGRPMDRLVCGDVGFGKTESRAADAFLAVMNGRQVALLCPTTLLAEQHAQNFATRFADWPVRIAELSRFRTGKETTKAIQGLADGSVDIVIGTRQDPVQGDPLQAAGAGHHR